MLRLQAAGERCEAIRKERGQAVGDLMQRMQIISHSMDRLNAAPPTEEQVNGMQTQLDWRLKHSPDLVYVIEDLRQGIALADITEPAARAAKRAELARTRAAMQKQVDVISRPYDERLDAASEPIKAMSKQWAQVLSPYFREPKEEPFSWLKRTELYWQSNNTGQLAWRGADGVKACRGAIWLHTKLTRITPDRKLIDGKYPMSWQSKGIEVTCGYFSVFILPEWPDWKRDEAVLIDLLHALVDLDGLAALRPDAPLAR